MQKVYFCRGLDFHSKFYDQGNPIPRSHRSRGKAGVAVLWKSKIDHLITPVNDGSERLAVIIIHAHPRNVLIINAYMPTAGGPSSTEEFRDVLCEVGEIINNYHQCDIILLGDMNASLHRDTPRPNDTEFRPLVSRNGIQLPDTYPTNSTFVADGSGHISVIDYILPVTNASLVVDTVVLDESQSRDVYAANGSDHHPVSGLLRVGLQLTKPSTHKTSSEVTVGRPKWDKGDIPAYSHKAGTLLSPLV